MEELPSPLTIKVHGGMCSELEKLVEIVSKIIPEIEAARPGASGIQTLCLLVEAISEAKCLLQQWSNTSILYLALTGDKIMSRCNKTRNLLEHYLDQIQNMVSLSLATKISGIIDCLRRATFRFDPTEEKAGKVLQEMLHKYIIDEGEDFAVSCMGVVCCWLHISCPKALLIEKRSIKKQLSKVGGNKSKRKILYLFLNLLNKYPNQQQARELRHILEHKYNSIGQSTNLSLKYHY